MGLGTLIPWVTFEHALHKVMVTKSRVFIFLTFVSFIVQLLCIIWESLSWLDKCHVKIKVDFSLFSDPFNCGEQSLSRKGDRIYNKMLWQ